MLAEAGRRVGGGEPGGDLDACLARVAEAAPGGLRSIYLSTTHLSGSAPTTKIYLVGRPGALGPSVVEAISRAAVPDALAEPVRRAMAALGKDAVDTIGLAVAAGQVVGGKCYLVMPYLDFSLVKRLVVALDLSVGRALALMRWYRLFIGARWGRLGSAGIGLDLRRAGSSAGVEAYTFPSPHHIEDLGWTIDALWGRVAAGRSGGSLAGLLGQSWRGCESASMYLCGCGVEAGRFARLGRGTIYFGVGKGRSAEAGSAAGRLAGQARLEAPS